MALNAEDVQPNGTSHPLHGRLGHCCGSSSDELAWALTSSFTLKAGELHSDSVRATLTHVSLRGRLRSRWWYLHERKFLLVARELVDALRGGVSEFVPYTALWERQHPNDPMPRCS